MHVWPFFRQLSCKKLLNIDDGPACCILFTFPPGLHHSQHTALGWRWSGSSGGQGCGKSCLIPASDTEAQSDTEPPLRSTAASTGT